MTRLFINFLLLLALGFAQQTAACQCCCCCHRGLQDELSGSLPLADDVLTPLLQSDEVGLVKLKEQNGGKGMDDGIPEKHLTGEAEQVTGTGKIVEKQAECNIREEVDGEGKTKRITVTEKKALTGDVDKKESKTSICDPSLLDKGDETKKVEREEKISEILKDNITKEAVVKEKGEKSTSGEKVFFL